MATQDIVIGYAKIYYSPTGTALPDETSVAYGGAWPAGWSYLGDTTEPLTMAVDRNVFEVEIQQSNSPVKQSITKQTISLKTTLAEHTITTLQLVFLGTASSTASGASQKPYSQLIFGGETSPAVYQWGFEALYQTTANTNQPLRYFFWKGSIALDGDIPFDKGAVAGVPVAITVLADTSRATGQTGLIQITTGA